MSLPSHKSVAISKIGEGGGEQAVVKIWFSDVPEIKFKTIVVTSKTSVFNMRSDLIRLAMKGLSEAKKELRMDTLLSFQLYLSPPPSSPPTLLTDDTLWETVVNKNDEDHFLFRLADPSDVAKLQRMKSLPPKFGSSPNEAVQMDCSGPVFSMPLSVIMLDQGKGFIPFVVQKSIDFLKDHLNCESLFISSGDPAVLQELIDAFDRGEAVKIQNYTEDPNVVGELLITFFRRVPEAFFPPNCYEDLLKSASIANKKQKAHYLRFVCDRLPDVQHNLLESLFLFLHKYWAVSKSKMGTLIRLSAVFGPILLKKPPPKEDEEGGGGGGGGEGKAVSGRGENLKVVNKLSEVMIEMVDDLFGFFKLGDGVKFEDIYEVKALLGKGAFAVAKEVVHIQTGQPFAVKMISKTKLGAEDQKRLKIETDILKCVRHPNIIALKAVCETNKELYLVMELAKGGELFDHIVAQGGAYAEEKAQKIIKQLFQAIDYLHDLNIVHRDIKPENVLLKCKDSLEVKIADFGLAKIFDEAIMLQTACGSPEYVAPEILMEEKYGKPVDIWSIGVIAYIVLSGYPPFYNPNMGLLFKQILTAAYTFEMDCWRTVSKQAKDFVAKLLVVEPEKRLTAKQALSHPWLVAKSQSFINVHEKAHLERDLKVIKLLRDRNSNFNHGEKVNQERERFMEKR